MASHIASASKLDGLRACLESVRAQSWASKHGNTALCLLISWSAETPELAEHARLLLARMVPEQVALEQPRKCSQFEHYQLCMAFVRQHLDAKRRALWVGFSDDDDLWHPHRLETFHQGVDQVDGDKTVAQLRFPWFAVRSESAPPGSEGVRSTAEVDAMLQRGTARLWNTTADDGETSEHWTGLSRLALLEGFLSVAPPALLAGRFADLAWERASFLGVHDEKGRRMAACGESVAMAWTPGMPWLYFYNVQPGGSMEARCQSLAVNPDGTHASGGVDAATSEDYAHARRLLQTLPTLAASALRDEARQRDQGTKEAEERIAKKLAHLRRNLSVTCAQRLWPLRWLVTKEQMLAGLWKDLQRTWEAYPAATRGSASAEDCVLLDASRPLRSLLRDLNIPEAVATLFESSMQRLAQAALASAKKKVSSTG